jgi:hypothetical protein
MSRNDRVKKIVQEWQGKEILIPDDVMFKFFGRDTTCSYLWDKPYKIFTYVDSIGCLSCQLHLFDWKELIDLCRQQQIDVGFIFIVHSSDFNQFNKEVRSEIFNYPIIYDYNNKFEKLNHFSQRPYRTFLLDKDNKVQLIGSPINNHTMWELYKKVMTQAR